MPEQIGVGELEALIKGGVHLVDVLPRPEYDERHIPGAIHLSLREFSDETLSSLDRSAPIVVYCWDYQ
jgi:rhodanese-related sulfurtransferase